jgi:signal transduction histidine kinase
MRRIDERPGQSRLVRRRHGCTIRRHGRLAVIVALLVPTALAAQVLPAEPIALAAGLSCRQRRGECDGRSRGHRVLQLHRHGEWPFIRTVLDPAVDRLVTDGERLRLTLVNILINARQSIRDRRQSQKVDVPGRSTEALGALVDLRTFTQDGLTVISVRDSGIGFAFEDLSRVFDPYFTTERTGSGLGLAIAKNTIDGLGDATSIRSEVGDGTEMRIALPRLPSEVAEQ